MHKQLATFGATLLMLSPANATEAVPQAVKDACRGDYEKHCKMHKPDSGAVRDCMAAAFEKLSDPCVDAILDSRLAEDEAKPSKEVRKVAEGKPRRPHEHARRREAAHRPVTPQRVAGYIQRGTKIANFYVTKAFAKAFR